MTVVTDLSVWEQAREAWLTEHGYDLPPSSPSLRPVPTAANGQVALEWTLGGGADSYRVKRALSSGGPYETVAELARRPARTPTRRSKRVSATTTP